MSYWSKVPPPHATLHHISMFLGQAAQGGEAPPKELLAGMTPKGEQGNVADLLAMFPDGNVSIL